MATSEVEIVNSAFRKLGAERILDLNEDNTRARLAKEAYPNVRDKLLRSHPWRFATSYQEIAQVYPKPADVFDYSYVFQLPADCMRVFSTDLGKDEAWEEIEGLRIACNQSICKVKFSRKITDVSKFDANFCEVLAWHLAAEFAYALTQSASAQKNAEDKAEKELSIARSYSAQTGSTKQVSSDSWINARR